MVDLLLELVLEVVGEALFAITGAVLAAAIDDDDHANNVMAAIGHALMGATAGGLSLVILRQQVTPYFGMPGISLFVAPACTGLLLDSVGRWWVRSGNVRMALVTFRGGFVFALAMAFVRFGYFYHPWNWL
jgi:hypothetical protein